MICKEWKNDVEKFCRWALNNGWAQGLEIDRRDNDGMYNPENCHFVTHQLNAMNRRPFTSERRFRISRALKHFHIQKIAMPMPI